MPLGHEVAVKLLCRAAVVSEDLMGGGSTSKLTHMELLTGLLHMAAGFPRVSNPRENENIQDRRHIVL